MNKIGSDMTFKKIFAYGSLINEIDLRRTVPEARNIMPAKLYGYKRVFDLESHYRFDAEINNTPICVLNVESTNNNKFINGICFDMDEESFDDLSERERTYDLIEATVHNYDNSNIKYTAYFFKAKGEYIHYSYLINSNLQFDYLSLCVKGCMKYGDQFLDDFKKSTHFHGVESIDYERDIWSKFSNLSE